MLKNKLAFIVIFCSLAIVLSFSLLFTQNTYQNISSFAQNSGKSKPSEPINKSCNQLCDAVESKNFAPSCSGGLACVQLEEGLSKCRNQRCPNQENCLCPQTLLPSKAPSPTTSPVPCDLSQAIVLRKEIPGNISDFTQVNSNNIDWYVTNDISTSKSYFSKGKIATSVKNFSLPKAPQNRPSPKTTYYQGDTACIKLHYDESLFDIASTLPGAGKLAGNAEICGVPLRCGNFEYGWVMRPKAPTKEQKIAFVGDLGLPYPGSKGGEDFADPEKVLQLIGSEKSSLAVLLGDLDYSDSPEKFESLLSQNLPPNLPVFTIAGNHDKEMGSNYPKYEELFAKIYAKNKDLYCDNIANPLTSNHCYFKNISLTSIYAHGQVNKDEQNQNQLYLTRQLAQSHTLWNFCTWHRTDTPMQLGSKIENFLGLDTYASCAKFGAMIVSAHEHSYARGKSIMFTQRNGQTDYHAVNNCPGKDGGNVCLSPNQTFVVVSGLGGHAQRRKQERCGARGIISNSNCDGKVGKDLWGSVYASDQKRSSAGVYFVEIPPQGTQAKAYFKTVDGTIRDQFLINRVNQNPIANMQLSLIKSQTASNTFSAKINFKNSSKQQAIQAINIRLCDGAYQNCLHKKYDLPTRSNETKSIAVLLPVQNQQVELSCTLTFINGTTQTCGDYLLSDLQNKTLNFELADHENVLNMELN